jgi:outer membrane receptor protein involved in Fe transport
MRLAAFLLTVLLQLSLKGECQTVTFSGKDVSLQHIFTTIKNQTGILFFYDATLLKDAKPVTIEWKNISLEKALNEIFKDQSLTWLLEDKTVTVIKNPEPVTSEAAPQSLPPIRVKGTITDDVGYPISNVTVMIKGTKKGMLSDSAGGFSIAADRKNILRFSTINHSPKEMRVQGGEMNVELQLEVKAMEALLVGGNLNAIKRKAEATSVTVIDSKTLERIPVNTLDQIFRGWVPGTNSFDVGSDPEGFPTLSIRGAGGPNSLTVIAVYIDGMEYAGGSGYLSQLDKNNIDRIEIVKGPGAATMFGTGSNGGIVQIFTRKGKPGQTTVNLTTSAGFYKSKWVEENPFQQTHSIETTTGIKNVSLKLGGSLRTVGAYMPDGGEKNKTFYASAGFFIGKLTTNLTNRNILRNFSLARKPYYDTALHPRTDIIIEPVPGFRTPAFEWFDVRPTVSRNKNGISETHIGGINLSHRTTENWVNYLDAGFTRNTGNEVPNSNGIAPLQGRYLSSMSSIMTMRYSNVLNLRKTTNSFDLMITSGAEYKKYSNSTTITGATTANTAIFENPDNKNYGAFLLLNPSYKNVYLTMGLRFEKNELFKAAWNPRLGLTTNFDTRSLSIKPRISWGRGISSPSYLQRFGQPPTILTVVYANPDLKPQSQQGFDYGLEVYDKKGAFKFELVYYDNRLKDMIAEEELGKDPTDSMLAAYKYTNVAIIANRGWEFSGEYHLGRLTLNGTLSIFNSTIQDTTGAYSLTELRGKNPGTRMRNLPKYTAGLVMNYNFHRLFGKSDKGLVSLSITELGGVRYDDYRKYALDVAYGRTPYVPGSIGNAVENNVFRVGLYADYFIVNDLRFFIQGSNILNDYEYEYSSDYPTHGASWLFGFKCSFLASK